MSTDEELKSSLQSLAEEFETGLSTQLGAIESAWVRVRRKGLDSPELEELLKQLHILTGTASSVGFEQIASAAWKVQGILKPLTGSKQAAIDDDLFKKIEEALNKLRQAIYTDRQPDMADLAQRLSASKMDSASLEAERSRRLIFMVDDDPVQAAQLATQVGYFGYTVQVFHNLDKLEEAVHKTMPAAILMDISFPEGKMAGYDTISSLRTKFEELPPVIYISINDNMSYRLQAVRVGGEAYFTKPVDVGILIDILDRLIFNKIVSPYRVLIIDDSHTEASYNAQQLNKVGILTEIASDPLNTIDKMISFNPDLVLLDMYMPDCTGTELATIIRQMEQFISIPIVFLSAETDTSKQVAAMGIGADDFLTKPIEPHHMITAVTNRIERYRKLRTLMNHDGLTGLFNHTTSKERLIQEVERARRQNLSLSYAMLDLDHFKTVNDTYGHSIGDRVLKSLAHMLKRRLRSNDSICRIGGEEFAVIFPNTDESTACQIMTELCESFAKITHFSGEDTFNVTFSCGVASFPNCDSAEKLSTTADSVLYKAKAAGRNRVLCTDVLHDIIQIEKEPDTSQPDQSAKWSDAELFNQIVNHSNNLILRFNREGIITFINDFACNFFGYKRKELLGKSLIGTILPKTDVSDSNLKNMLSSIMRNPNQQNLHENECILKNGPSIWVTWNHVPLLDPKGVLQEMLCIGIDISEHKRIEENLNINMARLNSINRISHILANEDESLTNINAITDEMANIFHAQHIGVAMLTEDGQTLQFVSDSPEEWTESPGVANLINLSEEPAAQQVVQSGKAVFVKDAMTNPLTRASHNLLKKHGINNRGIVPIMLDRRVTGIMNIDYTHPDQGISAENLELAQTLTGIISNAVESKRLLGAEQRQRKYFEALFQNIPTAVAMVDAQANLLMWNPSAEKLFGYSEEEVLGKNLDDLITSGDLQQEAKDLTRDSLLDDKLIHCITRRIRKDGSQVDVELLAVPVEINGIRHGSLAIYHDITELQQARLEAEAANAAKSSFLATMSHEIRTPLNAIIGMTTLLLDTKLTGEQNEFAETVRFSSETLLTIINDILDFSKIEAGHMELENQPFDLRECIESALDLVTVKAAELGIDLAYMLDNDVPHVIISDSTRLRQVLLNLLSNAIKFTEKGEIVLSVSAEKITNIKDKTHRLHFSIRDTGIGIAQDQMDRLFQSFSQVDASITRKYGGTGLGLAISKRLAEMMGGEMWVESEGVTGRGSTFHFTILVSPSDKPMPVFMHRKQPELDGKKVLIVDDNDTNRYILIRQTQSWGMLCEETAKPLQALEWIKEGKTYDVILLDMQMPEMDGLTLAHEIQTFTKDKIDIPLVMLTSSGLKEKDDPSVRFDAYLTKPIKPAMLYASLLNILGTYPAIPKKQTTTSEFAIEPGTLPPMSILLAEDIVINQKVVLQMLKRLGCRADVAANGLEVLDALRRQHYDLILMDVQMPEMDGLEATRRVRSGEWIQNGEENNFHKQPYIVAMTANAMQGDREICLQAGMDEYMSKPIRVDDLVRVLSQVRLPRNGTEETPANPVEQASPAIDEQVFRDFQISMDEDDPENMVQLIKDYFTETQQLIKQLKNALKQGDKEIIHRSAHSIKSTSMLFGAMQLAELCKSIEIHADRYDKDGDPELAAQVDAAFKAVKEALKEKMKSLDSSHKE